MKRKKLVQLFSSISRSRGLRSVVNPNGYFVCIVLFQLAEIDLSTLL